MSDDNGPHTVPSGASPAARSTGPGRTGHTTDSGDPGQAGRTTGTGRTFLGHPWGLATLSGVEMWERFSFYGLQGILAYYLYYSVTAGGLGMDKEVALSIVGAYGGLVYLTSVAGAWVSDRVLSAERSLFLSAVLIMIGHLSLSLLPGYTGLGVGLACVAVGSGTLKTTSQVVLGSFYSEDDPRRDGGFSIYYVGVNIGALFGPLLTGTLWGWRGFHWGFGAAALLMFIGLVQYTLNRRGIIAEVGHTVANPLPRRQYLPWGVGAVVVVAVVVAVFATGLVPLSQLATSAAVVALVAAVVLWVQMHRSPLVTAPERAKLVGFIPMFLGSVVFWTVYQQQFTTLAVYADQRLNRSVFGHEVTPTVVQSISPVFVIVFAGVAGALWTRLGDRQPTYPVKFGLGIILCGAAMLVLLPFAGGAANSTPMLALAVLFLLFVFGELLLSPVGNSLVTRLAPTAFPTRMFALWMLSVSLGTALSGTVAGYYDPSDAGAERAFLLVMFLVSAVVGGVLLVLARPVNRLLAGGRAAVGAGSGAAGPDRR
ncbi:peptide MFS transporter [Corynebacterium bovis]|uniref:MFS transporter n=4 Tax=Corynebacterium bovis TaxID=36808 RepID=A0A426Q390_9CORY|nr:peptide MFS transporter [Corynebacterium bovis]RRO90295.1 MFS transporter [Corynebacterium bovis]RRO94141.1 MFS transporter [Corynebacterium bovis]RRO97943.1 MFS transporter [Corynebacterium bovis]RRO99045.1 MFS transporter [Corynebacterium bovis]RRQ02783.1 MFS transporter [Corynebacterium bovis]